jgi:guanylate kinase
MAGNLIIVSAPSGAGKTTLVAAVVRRLDRVKPSISFTARSRRTGETDGVDYHFVGPDEFDAMVSRGEFLEWAEVHGNRYGTSRSVVEQLLNQEMDVILTIDVQGAANARALYPGAITVFVLPPSYAALVDRLRGRGANVSSEVQLRLLNGRTEIEQFRYFDYLVINDDLQRATAELAAIIVAARCRRERRAAIAERILTTFVG